MSGIWRKGSTTAWRATRADVLLRDAGKGCRIHRDGWCARAGVADHVTRCTDGQTTAHHTRGRRVTGDDPRWLVAGCMPCNLAIGDPSRHADPRGKSATKW